MSGTETATPQFDRLNARKEQLAAERREVEHTLNAQDRTLARDVANALRTLRYEKRLSAQEVAKLLPGFRWMSTEEYMGIEDVTARFSEVTQTGLVLLERLERYSA